MFRKSLKSRLNRLVFAAASLAIGLSLPMQFARAEIINDIDQLDKEKPPKEKDKVEKDKTKPKEGTPKAKPTKPAKEIDPSTAVQPDKPDLIPEPVEDNINPPAVTKPAKTAGTKSKSKTKEQRQKLPVHLQSNGTTTYSKDRSTLVMQNDVIITQEDMRLESDEARVTMLPKGTKGPTENGVKSALLTGKVAMNRYSDDPTERINAKSDKAIFDNMAQTVTLVGNARLWQNGNLVKGESIVYDVAAGEFKIQKAQGVVQPERMDK